MNHLKWKTPCHHLNLQHCTDNIDIPVLLFCQVGGIYTVIRSKTGVSVNEMGDQYILLGPYKEYHARYMYESCVCHWHKQFFRQEIEEEDFPQYHPLGQAVDSQRETHGYRIHCGRY